MITIEQEKHGERVTGNELFDGWLGPWRLRRRRWVREYAEYYPRPYGRKRRLHKGPRT